MSARRNAFCIDLILRLPSEFLHHTDIYDALFLVSNKRHKVDAMRNPSSKEEVLVKNEQKGLSRVVV